MAITLGNYSVVNRSGTRVAVWDRQGRLVGVESSAGRVASSSQLEEVARTLYIVDSEVPQDGDGRSDLQPLSGEIRAKGLRLGRSSVPIG